jgi:hypothetical protein
VPDFEVFDFNVELFVSTDKYINLGSSPKRVGDF